MAHARPATVPASDPRHPLRGAAWRVLQFCHVIGARPNPKVDDRLRQLLDNEAQWQLLQRLSPFDRAHHLRVYDVLRDDGCDNADVLRAALLHDIGKSDGRKRAHAGHRTVKVLLALLGPRWLERLARNAGHGPRHGLYLALHHAELGARLAQRAGASERCCELIAGHESRERSSDPGLVALIAADERAIR